MRSLRNLRRSHRTGSRSSSSDNTMQTADLSKDDGSKLVLEFVTGDMLTLNADAMSMSVNDNFEHSGGLRKVVRSKGGDEYINAMESAKSSTFGSRAVRYGEVLRVDTSSVSGLPFSSVFLVVRPDKQHVRMAYKNVLAQAARYGVKTVIFPGLGCGDLDLAPTTSADRFCDVLKELINTKGNPLGSVEKIILADCNKSVVFAFWDAFKLKLIAGGGGGAIDEAPASSDDDRGSPSATVMRFADLVDKADDVADDICVVCQSALRDQGSAVVRIKKCTHQLHADCFQQYVDHAPKKCCPTCNVYFAMPEGNQPRGSTMHVSRQKGAVAGHDCSEYYYIKYEVPSGIQEDTHLRPGVAYHGTHRHAYLPCTPEGELVKRLLEKAFDCRLIFTVGDSLTSGAKNVVTWANIHHKTSLTGGTANFGYPDESYLVRVKDELSAAGITPDMLDS